jgi:hypothetical protein
LADGFIKPEDQEPDITGFEFYYDAFAELSTARQIGLGIGPIPFTAISEYTKLFEIPDFEEFCYVIRRMDQTYLELNVDSKQAVEQKKAGRGAPSGSR